MRARHYGQGICLVALALSISAAVFSCATGVRVGSLFEPDAGGHDASTGDDDHTLPLDDGGTLLTLSEGGSACVPKTCGDLGYSCGPNGDQCGGLLQCGDCPPSQRCGYGGYSVCGSIYRIADGGTDGGSPFCVPTTCAALGYNCGPAGDGCGGRLDCGTCTSPQFCGGGSKPSVCGGDNGHTADGAVACKPKTCADWGFNCGPAGDGCGGKLQCGMCSGTDICGGGNKPGVCGNATCVNLCSSRVACDGGIRTTVSGTVRAGMSAWTGATPDPVPNVLVYVPNAPLQPFAAGTACRQCGADVSGSPLVSAYTDFDGTFTLTNVPPGASIPIVIQLGRWRRQFTFSVPACASTGLGNLYMPRNQSEGDIPLTAVSTGNVDPLECVLLKMGVDQAEFTPDNGTGRIHIYGGGPLQLTTTLYQGPGATVGNGTRQEGALLDTGGTVMNYDQVLLPCWGNPLFTKTAAELANLIAYADGGGHFFATHYSYLWLVNNGELNNVAQWNPNFNNPEISNPTVTTTWTLNVSTAVPPAPPAPHAGTFAKWLNVIGALSNSAATLPANPQVAIASPRHDANAVASGSVDWIDGTDPTYSNSLVEHFTFNAPLSATTKCGHAIFSDFHVANIANGGNLCSGATCGTNGQTFPNECTKTFTPQEKILEFMIWDLSSCVGHQPPPTCRPVDCAQQNIGCGPAGDGCGNGIDCGPCALPLTCGGGGVPGQCGAPDAGTCVPVTCPNQNIGCGPAGDGCGNAIDCGPCTPPFTCGGGGVPGQCGAMETGTCMPQTCQDLHLSCGPAGDGCGNAIDCGPCILPMTCGGGGIPGQCGGGTR
jgi:hypothetical protein